MPQIIKQSFDIETEIDGEKSLREIERFARTCYKSEDKIGDFESTKKFVGRLLHTNKHEGILDHHQVSVRVVCDRGVSHEIVRHRIGAYLQESTRYCDYAKDGEIQVIEPPDMLYEQKAAWLSAVTAAEHCYNAMRNLGCSPQIARSVLPTSLKTELVMTLDLRSWRNFFRLRCSPSAHPQMQDLACAIRDEFKRRVPVVFDDL